MSPKTTINAMRVANISISIFCLSLVAGTNARADLLNSIGRFETNSSKCEYRLGDDSIQKCSVIQMDSKTATITAVRFIGEGKIRGSSLHLTFVANAPAQTTPLRCRSGRCTLKATYWIAIVSSVAKSKFDELGLAKGLPQASPAKGDCQLNNKQLRCRARTMNGEILSGVASL